MARKPFDPDAILNAVLAGERACGDFAFRIDREGTWHFEGTPVRRLPLVKLFASVLRRAADGSYWLVTPVEQGRITVEDAPFTIVELDQSGDGAGRRVRLRTNLDEWVELDEAHPLRLERGAGGAEVPYVTVRDRLEARVIRPVYYELVGLAREVDGRFGVESAGGFFPLSLEPLSADDA